ncbi:MAG: glycosyltransferase family 2 protein [Thermaceae bacterium]|nr:glycosyltransferase family 2 protein [Thermaceae bacterium]
MNPKITVFTPSYNRAKLLPRTYESLCRQTLQDFEWLIVDDGSSDDTKTVVESWKEAPFPIRYIYKSNGGKHTAINRGVQEARGEYFVILDSDDWLTDSTLERMMAVWEGISDQARFSEVVGLFAYQNGDIVGNRFPKDMLDSDPAEIQAVYKVWGDKFGCHRTAVLREFPFPEDLGKFVTENLVWYRIARRYSTRFVNEVWAYKEYQPGGLTANFLKIRLNSSPATLAYYSEAVALSLEKGYPLGPVLRNSINYVRFALHAKKPFSEQMQQFTARAFWWLGLLPGAALYLNDLGKTDQGKVPKKVT